MTPFRPHFQALALASLLGACLWALPASQATAQAAATAASRVNRSGDHIVAVVNTELVTAIELSQRIERAREQAQRQGRPLPPDEQLRQRLLDTLIDERVLVTHAREFGARVDEAELDRAVANIAAQNQLTLAQLRQRLQAEGLDYARFRGNLRDQLLVERVREREMANRIRVTDSEIDQWLQAQQQRTGSAVQYNIAQILISLPEGADAQTQERARQRAETALARVRAGEPFAQVAAELSEDSRRQQGGEIGLRAADKLPDLFVAAVRELAPGELAGQALRSPVGWHVLKLLDKQGGNALTSTETRARHILLRVPEQDQGDAVVRRLAELRERIVAGNARFEDLAREVSEDGSAPSGGDLGWVAPGAFVPEFETAMNQLAIGAVSEPVVSRFGVHLIQVQERRQVQIDPQALREQARNQLREQKYEAAFQDWVRELRLRAYVELREPPA